MNPKIEFKVVDKSLRENRPVRGGSLKEHPLVKVLLNDETVFVEAQNNKGLAKFYDTAKSLNKRFHMQKGMDQDKLGFVLWFSDREVENA